MPFDFANDDRGGGGNELCGACIRHHPAFDRARSVMAYDDASKSLVLSFKHADRTDAAPEFARWMVRAGSELLTEADVLMPVPLHWSRLLKRRYNQAALLAFRIGQISNIQVLPRGLLRVKRTPTQGRLSPSERKRNVRGAFRVREQDRGHIKGKKILLIDDVLTSGATVEEAAKTLKRGKAARVDVLTLSRVLRPLPS